MLPKNVPQMERHRNHEFLKLRRHSSEFVSVRNRTKCATASAASRNSVVFRCLQKSHEFLRDFVRMPSESRGNQSGVENLHRGG
jgi:hypothetical protein